MASADKLIAAMRANRRRDWTIGDIEAVCRARGIVCPAPTRGSHDQLKHRASTAD